MNTKEGTSCVEKVKVNELIAINLAMIRSLIHFLISLHAERLHYKRAPFSPLMRTCQVATAVSKRESVAVAVALTLARQPPTSRSLWDFRTPGMLDIPILLPHFSLFKACANRLCTMAPFSQIVVYITPIPMQTAA